MWVDNVRQDATSLGVRDWQVLARDRGQWKAVVEAAEGLQSYSKSTKPLGRNRHLGRSRHVPTWGTGAECMITWATVSCFGFFKPQSEL